MVRSPGSAQGKGGIHTTLPPAASRVCGNNENKNVLLSRPQLGSSEKCVLLSQAPCTSVATTHCQRGRLKDTAGSATMAHAGSRLVTGHRFVNSSLAPLLPVKKLKGCCPHCAPPGCPNCEAKGTQCTSAGLLPFGMCLLLAGSSLGLH